MVDFERFINTVDGVLKQDRDVIWILAGRTESLIPKIKKGFGQVQDVV